MQIYGFNKTTLLDYPKHIASTIFVGGCNMRCPFCHNASLVTNLATQPTIAKDKVLDTFKKRIGILEGVCISGGEPTLYPELPSFISEIKTLGLKVKLDTNGSNPSMIKFLIDNNLIDYIAMDIKNSKEKYIATIGVENYNIAPISETVSYLLTSPIDYEFRTTVVHEHHTKEDMVSIGQWIKGAKAYYLQSYKDSGDVLLPGLSSPTKETLLEYVTIIKPYVQNISLRGVD